MASNPKDPKNLEQYLLTTYAPLIHSNIKALKASGKLPESMEDWEFHEPAMHGLMQAIDAYDPEVAKRVNTNSKNPFKTLANSRIRGKIQDHADKMFAIPKHIRMQAKRFESQNRPQGQLIPQAETPAAVPEPTKPKPE